MKWKCIKYNDDYWIIKRKSWFGWRRQTMNKASYVLEDSHRAVWQFPTLKLSLDAIYRTDKGSPKVSYQYVKTKK